MTGYYCTRCGSIHGIRSTRIQACLDHTCPDRPGRRWLRILLGRLNRRGYRHWYRLWLCERLDKGALR